MLGFVLAFALVPSSGGSAWLDVTGTGGCIDPAALRERTTALLGPDTSPSPTRVALRAKVVGDETRVEIELQTTDGPERRTLEGTDCNVLTTAVALVIAVNVDPIAVAATVDVQEASAGSVAPVDPSTSTETVATGEGSSPSATLSRSARASDPPPPPPRAPPRASLTATVGGGYGVLPRGDVAFEGTAGVAWPRARVMAGGLALVGPDAPHGRFRLYAGVVRACGGPARGAVEIPICLGTEIGVLQAQGIQLALPRNSNALWIAAAAGVRPRWVARPRFALGGAADLVVPLIRHSFATVDAGPVHRVAPVAARLGILVEVRLP